MTSNQTRQLRTQAEEYLTAGRHRQAHAMLAAWWHENQTLTGASYMLQMAQALRPHLELRPCKLRVLRSCTVEPALQLLRAGAFAGGIDLDFSVCPFNAYAQEILDGSSELYRERRDVIFLMVSTRALAPALWQGPSGTSTPDYAHECAGVLASYQRWVEAIRARCNAALVLHTLEQPALPAAGILDMQAGGQIAAIRRINEGLAALASGTPDVYLLDYDALVARYGRTNWWDEGKWRSVRMPIRAEHIPTLANEWLRFLHPLRGRLAKVAVTDLDNTLWGGILGEDGLHAIRSGPEGNGIDFWQYQQSLLRLQQRGILLAIASKNNPADALEALERHPGILLRPNHFASIQVHWQEKSQSLRQIAAELNVGLDSLVFLDDNPVERQQVRLELPEVTVLEMPADPAGYASAVSNCPLFERLSVSPEDTQRTEYYVRQRERSQLERNSASLEDFLHSLDQRVYLIPASPENIQRISQLTQKTNQFNLTTRRYSETEVRQLADSADHRVFTIRVVDRFGDNGLVGACILALAEGVCHLDTFLLSCRVIGRTVETAMLSAIAQYCRASGISRLEGYFLPTRKNAPAADFYTKHGFTCVKEDALGSLWRLDLETAALTCPPWIQVTQPEELALV